MAAKFTADAKAHVNTLQDKILEMDSFLEQAKDNRHCVTLVDDITKLNPRFHKALKGVRLVVVNAEKPLDITALAKLQEDVQQCMRDYEDVRKDGPQGDWWWQPPEEGLAELPFDFACQLSERRALGSHVMIGSS